MNRPKLSLWAKNMAMIAFLLAGACAQKATAGHPAQGGVTLPELSGMVGSWEGRGWMAFGPGQRREFTQTEQVTAKLGGAVIVVEGTGLASDGSGGTRVVHSALGVISQHADEGAYTFKSYLATGQSLESVATLEKGRLVWGFEIPGRGRVRYTLYMPVGDRWYEIGERSMDGENWVQFIEMDLARVK